MKMKKYLRLIPLLATAVFMMLCLTACPDPIVPTENTPWINLNKSELVLEVGSSEMLVAYFEPSTTTATAHTWKSSDPNVAIVDEQGLVTSVTVGEAVITATAMNGGHTATCKVKVVEKLIPITEILISKKETTVLVGSTFQLEARILPDNATCQSLIWSSDEEEIAVVNPNTGVVTTKKIGVAVITATAKDGSARVSCKVNVSDEYIRLSGPDFSSITAVSAQVTGRIESLGMPISECGICYSKSPGATVDNKKKTSSDKDYINVGINNLEMNTSYYARLFAVCDNRTYYGEEDYFTTIGVDVSSPQFSSVTTSSVTVEGIINGNGAKLDECGVCYSTEHSPTIDDNKKTSFNSGEVAIELANLKEATTYFARLYAVFGDEIYYGGENSFETMESLRTNFKVSEVWEDKVVLKSEIPVGYKNVKVCYGSNPSPKITDYTATASGDGDGEVSVTLTHKTDVMYVRSYEMQGSRVVYNDDEVTFKTNEIRISYEWDFYAWNEIYRQIRTEINYNIDVSGTYEVHVSSAGLSKGDENKKSTIYLSEGSGRLYYQAPIGGDYLGGGKYVTTNYGREYWYYLDLFKKLWMTFTNMETGVVYRFDFPSRIYYKRD